MIRILEAFANDNLCVNPVTYRGNLEYNKALDSTYKAAEELDGKMNEEEKKLFEQFRNAQSTENQIYTADSFIRGYRIGVLMTMEVFIGQNDLVHGKGEEM